jgi:hypothetical protein
VPTREPEKEARCKKVENLNSNLAGAQAGLYGSGATPTLANGALIRSRRSTLHSKHHGPKR